MKKITADTYMKLLMDLPNPTAYVLNHNNVSQIPELVVNYIEDKLQEPYDVHVISRGQSIHKNNMLECSSVTFEICFNGNICFWQPKDGLCIVPQENREEILRSFHDYRSSRI